jgi:hypothetical protein
MSQQQSKDPIFNFDTIKEGVNSKGGKRTELFLSSEKALELATALVEKVAESEDRGVKFDIHQAERTQQATGRKFNTAFMFVKAKQAAPTGGFGGGGGGQKTAVPKASHSDLQDKIAKLKGKQV